MEFHVCFEIVNLLLSLVELFLDALELLLLGLEAVGKEE